MLGPLRGTMGQISGSGRRWLVGIISLVPATRPLADIPVPVSEVFRLGSGRSGAAIAKPLIGIEISPERSDASQEVRIGVRGTVQGISDKKKAHENLGLSECYRFGSLS